MVYTVSITSQGQISIPAKIRRQFGIGKKGGRATVTAKKGEIIIKPVKDFFELKGSLAHLAIKGKTIDEIIQLEEEAIAEGFVEDYKESK